MDFAIEGLRGPFGEFGREDGAEERGAHDVVVGWGVEAGVDEGVGREGGGRGGDVDVGGEGCDLRNLVRRHDL